MTWRFVTDVNALGVLICMQEAIRRMPAQGDGGKIINTASIAGNSVTTAGPLSRQQIRRVALTQAAARSARST